MFTAVSFQGGLYDSTLAPPRSTRPGHMTGMSRGRFANPAVWPGRPPPMPRHSRGMVHGTSATTTGTRQGTPMNSNHPHDMKAVLQDRYGDHAVLRVGRAPVPAIRDDQVLIKVRAAGLDRGTEHLVAGK